MDPCSFVRIIVGNLAVRFPAPSSSSSEPSVSGTHTSSASAPNCYCKIKFKSFPRQIVSAPVIFQTESEPETSRHSTVAACFSLNKAQIEASSKKPKLSVLSIETYSRGEGLTGASCGLAAFPSEKLLGRFEVSLDLKAAETKTCLAHNGWVALGSKKGGKSRNKTGSDPELHVSIRVEPDPRFVFRFDGEPECSPQVFQVQGNTKQAVFTCKFGARNSGSADRNLLHSSSMMSETRSSCISSMKSEKEQPSKERKGWSVTVHDLSGSPVAMASMVTPFVPSPGSNRVTQSSPGAWLILRPDGCTWKPWGRLEAWHEAGGYSDAPLGYRFELFQDGIATEVSVSSSISLKNGGRFVIDVTGGTNTAGSTPTTTSPQGSLDLGSGSSSESRPASRPGSGSGSDFGYLLPQHPGQGRGFVMSASVEGVGKQSKPEVEVGVTHVTCTEDAAAHVALAAAVDLSLDACRLFSQKLRKELRQQSQLGVV